MIRRVFMLACIGGGVWGALHLLRIFAEKATGEHDFSIAGEGVLLAIPVGLIGALVGALVGGILFPSKP